MSYSDPYINAIFLACRKTSKSLIRDFGEVEKLQVSLKGVSDFVSLADTKAEKTFHEATIGGTKILLMTAMDVKNMTRKKQNQTNDENASRTHDLV